jgi:hypothetical protein
MTQRRMPTHKAMEEMLRGGKKMLLRSCSAINKLLLPDYKNAFELVSKAFSF